MGENKIFLQMNGEPLLLVLIKKLLVFSTETIIVLGCESEKAQDLILSSDVFSLGNISIAVNEEYESGTFSSLQTGLGLAITHEWCLYHFCDQPFLPPVFYVDLISRTAGDAEWIQPMYREHKGHPVLLNSSAAKKLLSVPRQFTIRDAARQCGIRKTFYDCPYPQILHDLDTPQDFKSFSDD